MKISKPAMLFVMLFVFLFSINVHAQNWGTLKTEHFIIYYEKPYEYRAWRLLETLESQRDQLQDLFGNELIELPVIIQDLGTYSNGLADAIYYTVTIYPWTPGSESGISFGENWLTQVGRHEYVHMLHLTKSIGFNKFLVDIIGDPMNPNLFSPLWQIEGLATYHESQPSPFSGRLNDGRFDAIMAAKLNGNDFPDLSEATYSPLKFPDYRGPYLFGSLFTDFLTERYGYEKYQAVIDDQSESISAYVSPIFPSLGLDRLFEKHLGKTTPELWDEWREYEKACLSGSVQEGERITDSGWYAAGPVVYDDKIYFTRKYPVKGDVFDIIWLNELVERDLQTETERILISETTSFGSRIRIRDGKLYYTLLNTRGGYGVNSNLGYGYYYDLYEYDLATNGKRHILADEIRGFEPLPGGEIIYSVDRRGTFGSRLIRYSSENGKEEVLKTELLIDEIVSYNGSLVVTAKSEWQNYSTYIINPEEKSVEALVGTQYLEGGISISGETLFFSSNYESNYSIFSYGMKSHDVRQITSGLFESSPAYDARNSMLYYLSINADGYDLYRKKMDENSVQKNRNDVFKSGLAGTDSTEKQKPVSTLDRSKVTRGGYMDNLGTLIPGIFPKVLARIDGQEVFSGVGYRERDALAENFYEAGFYYDPETESLKFGMEYTSYLFAPLAFNLYYSAFDEESLGLNLYIPLMKNLDSGLSALYFGVNFEFLDHFHRREVAPFVMLDFRLPRVRGRLSLRTVFEDRSIGSEIDRFGLYLNAGMKYYFDSSFFSMNLNVVSDDDNPSDTFVKIRGYDYLPPGKSGVRFRAEYSTILFNVRKGLWNPNIFLEDISGHLFVDGLIANDSDSQLSAGVELHFETRLFFYLPLDLGVGYAINKQGDSSFTFLATIPLVF